MRPLEKMSKINHRLFKQAMIIPLKALKLGSLLQAGLVRTVVCNWKSYSEIEFFIWQIVVSLEAQKIFK